MVGGCAARNERRETGNVSSDQRRFPFLVSRLPVLVGLVLLGCATLRSALPFQAPEFTLHELRVTSIGLTGGTMDLVFDVYNPNSYRLRSTRLQVGIDLESTDRKSTRLNSSH